MLPNVFEGSSYLTIDSKWRFAVPVKYREALREPSDGKVVLTVHPHGYLMLYPLRDWLPIRDRIDNFSGVDAGASMWKRLMMGCAEHQILDATTGRLLITQVHRKFAGLGEEIVFIGQGAHIQIWDVAAWEEQATQAKTVQIRLPSGAEDMKF